jgi:hypothetical protein
MVLNKVMNEDPNKQLPEANPGQHDVDSKIAAESQFSALYDDYYTHQTGLQRLLGGITPKTLIIAACVVIPVVLVLALAVSHGGKDNMSLQTSNDTSQDSSDVSNDDSQAQTGQDDTSTADDTTSDDSTTSDNTSDTTSDDTDTDTLTNATGSTTNTDSNTSTNTGHTNTDTNTNTGPTVVKPTVKLALTAPSIVKGSSTKLTWSTTNAPTICTASVGWTGTKAINGSISVNPTATTTYYLTCANSAGSAAASAKLTVTAPVKVCSHPSDVLNLKSWKLTLPTGKKEDPTEILQPKLTGYEVSPYFINNGCTSVTFRAPTNGVTTSSSGYPRSELREMKSNGKDEASWSSSSGTSTMEWEEAFTRVPNTKRHLVGGQIHGAEDDVITIRLEYPKLFIEHNGDEGTTLTTSYKLGTHIKVKWIVSGGKIKTYYNGALKETYAKKASGLYFKAGAYTQSNCEKGAPCSSSNYGEVILYSLKVTH